MVHIGWGVYRNGSARREGETGSLGTRSLGWGAGLAPSLPRLLAFSLPKVSLGCYPFSNHENPEFGAFGRGRSTRSSRRPPMETILAETIEGMKLTLELPGM
jgi:hypothetical protein